MPLDVFLQIILKMTDENNMNTLADKSKSVYTRDLSRYVIIFALSIKYLFSRDGKLKSIWGRRGEFEYQNNNAISKVTDQNCL